MTLTMTGNRNITANYAINSYSLAITSANGTVAKTPSQASYNYGTSVTLTATPGTGYSFTSWSGDTTSAANPMTLTMTAIATSPPTIHQQLQLSHHIGQRNGRQDSEPGSRTIMELCYTDGDTGHGLQLYELERRHHERCQPDDAHEDDAQSQHHRNYAINSYSFAITSANGTVARLPASFVQLWNFCYTDGDTGHGLQLTSWTETPRALPTR